MSAFGVALGGQSRHDVVQRTCLLLTQSGHQMARFWRGITRPRRSQRALNCYGKGIVMTIESIIRRRAFRDGFYDGRQGCPMRRLATRKARWLYALGRIFANVAPTNLQVYEQRHATEAAVAAFRAMPVRCMAR